MRQVSLVQVRAITHAYTHLDWRLREVVVVVGRDRLAAAFVTKAAARMFEAGAASGA